LEPHKLLSTYLLDVLIQELAMEIVSHRVVDESLLHVLLCLCLVFEDAIVVPLPFDNEPGLV